MTTQSRIAAFLSTSALCLGLVAAPSAFAAQGQANGAKHAKHAKHAHKTAAKTAGQAAPAATPAK